MIGPGRCADLIKHFDVQKSQGERVSRPPETTSCPPSVFVGSSKGWLGVGRSQVLTRLINHSISAVHTAMDSTCAVSVSLDSDIDF